MRRIDRITEYLKSAKKGSVLAVMRSDDAEFLLEVLGRMHEEHYMFCGLYRTLNETYAKGFDVVFNDQGESA